MTFDLSLNAEQQQAVEHPGGPLLVIAGAGSGKTRVLTARVARLLEQGTSPEAILAFTFTNRAAREMRERIEARAGEGADGLWVGTFHATAVRILRREAAAAGLPREFTIYDRDDQEGILKDVMEALALPDTDRLPVVLGRISDAKNRLLDPEAFARDAAGPFEHRIAEAYARYQEALRAAGALDFDDLIAGAVRLLERDPAVGGRYARRFQHVLVDEYQDTNHAQFRFVQALAQVHRNLFVVGDDDQSIYGWRGASLANVLEFEEAFPGASIVRLEQNYRSTGAILAAANAVIANNRSRKGKTLWSERERGAPLAFVLAMDELDEARRIREAIVRRVAAGGRKKDCAVLYRTNAQSRALETELRHAGIPYEIVGGVSFYQRREVKDVLAYLRLAVNPADAAAFWRVWNTPRRGLGAGVEKRVQARMGETGLSPLAALRSLTEDGALTRAARSGALELLDVVGMLGEGAEVPLPEQIARLLDHTHYLEYLDEGDDAEDRRANVRELMAAAGTFSATGQGLAEFLSESALVTDVDRMSDDADRVVLLTAHNAKGLEFPFVVVAGLEEGLLPHGNSLDEPHRLEEERRLFYVALTRARDAVLLTAAAYRRRFDGAKGGAISRFVEEIPVELLERDDSAMRRIAYDEEVRRRAMAGPRRFAAERHDDAWDDAPPPRSARAYVAATPAPPHARKALGREVFHDTFGRGVVVDAEGMGEDVKYTVRFRVGMKKVLGRFLTAGDGDPA